MRISCNRCILFIPAIDVTNWATENKTRYNCAKKTKINIEIGYKCCKCVIFNVTCNLNCVFKSFNKVRISGISGKLLVRTGNQLQIADELAHANLIKKPDGYYLTVTAYINKENYKQIETNGKEIGLDFGIKTNITTSDGEKLDVYVEESDRLKKLQRELFRKVKGSNNRYKTIKLIQREYQKLSNKKKDKANKIVSKLKQYSTIVI